MNINLMNLPYWNNFQVWLQNQKMMGQLPQFLSDQQTLQMYQQFVFMNYGFVPNIPMLAPQPMPQIPTMTPVQPTPTSQSQGLPISQIQRLDNQQNKGKIKELIPRTLSNQTISMGNGQNIINITLNASTGNKTVINASADTTIENLLKMYTKKLGLPDNVIGKDIMFLYNGAQLDFKSKSTIGSMFRNTAVITVYDLGGIIGA